MMRHSRLIIVFTVILGVLPLWGQELNREQRNSVAAVVNNKVITAGMVLDASRQYLAGQLPTIEAREQAKSEALNALINRELVLQEYGEQKFTLPDSIFEKRIKDRMLEGGYPTRASLVRALKKRGTTYDEYARSQREEIIFMIMLGEFASTKGIVISPRRIEEHYIANKNQYRRDVEIQLQMIVLSESKHGGAEATRRLADEIHSKLVDGDSFTQMAQVYSDLYADAGGFRPERDKKASVEESGTLHKSLEDVAFGLGRGQISGVVQHGNQCWILRCDEIQQKELRSLAEVRDEIEDALMDEEIKARRQKWFNKLRAKAYISERSF